MTPTPTPTGDIDELVAPAAPPADSDLSALHARLAQQAEREGLLDVAYRITPSPFGPLLVAVTPGGVVRVAFEREDHDAVLDQLAREVSPGSCARAVAPTPPLASSTSTSPGAAMPSSCRSTCNSCRGSATR